MCSSNRTLTMDSTVLLLLTMFAVLGKVVGDRRLTFVTVLYRHGDRSPVKAYPTDRYQESSWPQGFGQLSQEGMRQHFELGQVLRKRYQGFLNDTYDRHEISVRSTDYDRTLMSAEANLAGLYPPNGSQVFNPSLEWQPIPVHTVPQDEERLLSFPILGCPRYKILMIETERTEKYLNMTFLYKDLIATVREKTGLKNTTIETVWSVHDTLFCEARHNMTAPDWVTPEIMDDLRKLKDFGFEILFEVYKHQEKSRLQGGVLLGSIVNNISESALPDSNRRLKMMMLSAHDTTIVALQSSLSIFNGKQPPYASCHIFELYQEDNGSFTVAMFYRNDTTRAPYQLAIPSCDLFCPLEDFVRLTKPSIPEDWDKECMVESPTKDTEVVIGLAVCGCLLFLLIVLLLAVLCRQRDPSDGYSHIHNEIES
ncbi:lysosomal acid phosphatase isoform X1 [Oncorhynchus mykiss]|uniref:Lysosomal acid phosphatase n=2 Tax=Oncorhynchus mykiss TaxID=8022 RepID=A0A8C7W121_ONCMY|nr:lysosomal acid phosphatase isoform X1 [Oncorhynchus mykiss]